MIYQNIEPEFDHDLTSPCFPMVDLPFYGDVTLGNGTMFKFGMFRMPPKLFVGIESRGAYTFSKWIHWTYAQEKLNLLEADARNVADFLNAQLNCPDEPMQGIYRYDGWEWWPKELEKQA